MSKKTSIDLNQVRHIARLANLALKPDEEVALQNQLNQILEYFERLDSLDTSKAVPMSHSLTFTNELAADHITSSLSASEVLANAPDQEAGQFRVPAVME